MGPILESGLRQAAQMAPQQQAHTVPAPATGMSKHALALLLAGQGADIATTLAMVPQKRFREGNGMGLPAVLAIKGAALAGLPLLAKRMPRGLANTLGYIGGAAGAVPAAMNLRTWSR